MYSSYIWSPDRIKWVKHRPYKGCLFCDIIKGKKGLLSKVIYKDGFVMVLMNLYPVEVGHIMVVPVRHVKDVRDLDDDEFSAFNCISRKSISMLEKALDPTGFNTGMNLGRFSGRSIDHLHLQIIPRYGSETGFLEAIADTKVMPETISSTYKRIMRHAKLLR